MNSRRISGQKAFTLIEILVVTAVFASTLAIVLSLFVQGRRQSKELGEQVQVLDLAHLIRARLANDLAAYLPNGQSQGWIVKNASSLAIRRAVAEDECGHCGTCLTETFLPLDETVTYRFDQQRRSVLRNGEVIGRPCVLSASFTYRPFQPGSAGETIAVSLVLAPEELLAKGGSIGEEQQTQVTYTFHCSQATLEHSYEECIIDEYFPTPYSGSRRR